jgi:hypothetical protein
MPPEIVISPDIVNKVSYKRQPTYISLCLELNQGNTKKVFAVALLESIASYYQLDAETKTRVNNKHIKTTKNCLQCYSYGRKIILF